MHKTVFSIPKMDCPSEENMIRMALREHSGVRKLSFDLNNRQVTAIHSGDPSLILTAIAPLNFGASLVESIPVSGSELSDTKSSEESEKELGEAKVLRWLLAINAVMFAIEIVAGWVAESTGLIADSLDMFADAAVYGVSLYAVGRAAIYQKRAARMSGYLQLLLALGVIFEVGRRTIFGSEPEAPFMIAISALALIANVTCLALISKHREGGVHMRASWIFSANDVIANLGVIIAGILVTWLASPIPDLVIGAIISVVVFRGAISILKISKTPEPA